MRVRFVRLRLLVSVTTAVLLLCDVEAVVIILWCDVGVLTTISRVGVMLVGLVGFRYESDFVRCFSVRVWRV